MQRVETSYSQRLIRVYTVCQGTQGINEWLVLQNHWQMSRLMTKSTKWLCAQQRLKTDLGICPIWSESSLSAWRKLGSWATHWVPSEDSDQAGWMPRLIWVFAGWTCHFVGFIMRRLKCRNLHVFIFGECHVLLQLVHTKICDTLVQKLILKIQVKCKKS